MAAPATPAPIKKPRKMSSAKRGETLTAYLFLAPYLITAAIFTFGLMFYSFYISFTDQEGAIDKKFGFVGIDNYIRAVGDSQFLTTLANVVWYALIVTILQTIGAVLLATLLNSKMRFKQFFRTIFYAPSVASSVVISMIFLLLYLRTGFINRFLDIVGLPSDTAWLQNSRGLFEILLPGERTISNPLLRGPSVAWMAIMAMNIFTTIPTLMLMFLAALQDIPGQLYEAASIDGATKRQQFFKITLPLLRPTFVLVLVLSTIGTFQIFDQVAVMTQGGPANTTSTPGYLIYSKVLGEKTSPESGYGAAMAFILAAIIFFFTWLQRRFIEQGSQKD
jgi:multiple sugar transport system permease protein